MSSAGDSGDEPSTPRDDEQASTPREDGRAGDRPAGRLLGKVGRLLVHPVTLLLLTAVVADLLVPRITQQWQEHQRQTDIRRELVARVSREVGELFIATQFNELRAETQNPEEFDAAYRRWEVESGVLGAELRAYYRAEPVDQAWERCKRMADAYYAQSGYSDPTERVRDLQDVHDDLNLPDDIDLTDAVVVREEGLSECGQLIIQVLDRPMAGSDGSWWWPFDA